MIPSETQRQRIIAATAALLAEGGAAAVSTRAVSAAAGVQPPALYRLFGDKQGLLDAAATAAFTAYAEQKAAQEPSDDPVADLRAAWDEHVSFGLANPGVYALMYGPGRSGPPPPAVAGAAHMLAAHIHRIAQAGRLRVPETRAVGLVHAAGSGTTMALIATPPQQRDPGLCDLAREAVIAAITTDVPTSPEPGPAAAAVALGAVLAQTDTLSASERALMHEWLARVADG